jgi:4-hydroxy-tetrahydrodipicolinate synthase
LEETVRAAQCAEACGFEGLLTSYPPNFRPKSSQDIVDYTRALADQTGLALILFVVTTWGFRPLHPSHFPPDAVEQMAKFPTAAAIKYEANPPGMPTGLADILRRTRDTGVLVECPLEQYGPGLVEWFGMQWMGTSAYDSFADRVPKWLKLLHEGKWDEGMEVYWSYQPARDAKGAFHASFPGANLIHRVGWKYMSWLHGFSGGLLRMPQMRLTPGQMRTLKQGIQQSGFDVPASDDDFYTGRFPE